MTCITNKNTLQEREKPQTLIGKLKSDSSFYNKKVVYRGTCVNLFKFKGLVDKFWFNLVYLTKIQKYSVLFHERLSHAQYFIETPIESSFKTTVTFCHRRFGLHQVDEIG